ncbi:MAG TPA: NUDIX domain-containing protein [Prosthecobacter sp.]|nr:NUDIX domain-containing protein [Prosthecobacter sp.]
MPAPYHHCTRCGSPDVPAASPREFVCASCGYRHFITPFPAAVALVLDEGGRLLVCRRAHQPGLGRMSLPGGVIEPGETGEQAAAREVREETGLHLPAVAFRPLATLPNEYEFQDYLWPTLDLFYTVQAPENAALRPDPAEVSEALWLPPEDAAMCDFAFESNRRAVRLLLSARNQGPQTQGEAHNLPHFCQNAA